MSVARCPQCQTVASQDPVGGFHRCDRCGTRYPVEAAPRAARGRKSARGGGGGSAASGAGGGRDDVDELGIHPALARRYRGRDGVTGEHPLPAPDGFDTSDDDVPSVQLSPSLLEETQAGRAADTAVESKPGALDSKSAAPADPRGKDTRPLRPSRASDAGETPLQRPTTRLPRPSEPLPQLPGFRVIEQVGKGAMGRVFKAQDEESGELIAVKLLAPELAARPDFVARFEREAAALGRVSHPGVVSITKRGSNGDDHFFAMEYIEGRSLRRLLDDGPLSPGRALGFARQIAQGLGAAHDVGVIHRDLKPENILVEQTPTGTPGEYDERLVLVDFGLANILAEDEDPHPNLTKSRMTMGTVNYMAPEQRTDAKRVDERADLYALGVILYELLTSDLPLGRFALPTERGMILPRSIDDCISKSLARNPDERFQDAAAFDTTLTRIEGELTKAASMDTVVGSGSVIDELEEDYVSDPGSNLPSRRDAEDLSTASGKNVPPAPASLFKRPEMLWGGLALLLGAGAGLLFAPGFGAAADEIVAPGVRVNNEDGKTRASYTRETVELDWKKTDEHDDGWKVSEGVITWQGEPSNGLPRLLVAPTRLPGAELSVAATVRAEDLGFTGDSSAGYAGVALVGERQTIAVVRHFDGKCGVLHERLGRAQVRHFDCAGEGGEATMRLRCVREAGECFVSADGGPEVPYPAELGERSYRLALACADAACTFDGP